MINFPFFEEFFEKLLAHTKCRFKKFASWGRDNYNKAVLGNLSFLPLPVKICLLLILAGAGYLFYKNPEGILANIKAATKNLGAKTTNLVQEKIGQNPEAILGEKIDPQEKIKSISDEIIKSALNQVAELPEQVKTQLEEKVRVEVEKRIEEITKQIVIEKVQTLPEPIIKGLKEEICK